MSGLEVTMMKRIGELNAEVKYLQDKVERLTAEASYDKRVQLHVDKLASEFTQSEVERLQAEVKRLAADTLKDLSVIEELKTEVERLRKAGDAMVQLLVQMDVIMDMDSDHPEVEAWNAAKEGRPNE